MNNTTFNDVLPPIDWTQYYKSFILYFVFGYPSIVFNIFIIVVIVKDKSLREKHFLLVALAMGDWCIGFATASAVTIRFTYVVGRTMNDWVSHISCFLRPWNISYILGYQITSCISVLISCERFACVAFPIQYYNVDHKYIVRSAAIGCVVFSIVATSMAVVTVYFEDGLVHNTCLIVDGLSKGYATYNYAFCSICGILTATIYIASIFVMKANMKKLANNNLAAARLARQAKISKMMSVVLSCQFVLVAIPDMGFVISILTAMGYDTMVSLLPYFADAATLNSCLNLFFYAIFNADLRAAFIANARLKRNQNVHTVTDAHTAEPPVFTLHTIPYQKVTKSTA